MGTGLSLEQSVEAEPAGDRMTPELVALLATLAKLSQSIVDFLWFLAFLGFFIWWTRDE